MVTDEQVRRLRQLMQREETLTTAAAKAGMDPKTARKYREAGTLPSQMKAEHGWRTRPDPFAGVWSEVRAQLEVNAGLQAKTVLGYLQRRYPGQFADGQLRTLQRQMKRWRALEGPAKEVYFPQMHEPGQLCQSDFTHMGQLGITLGGQPFDHLIYHFVLTYSNWETGTICFSESFESLSEGLQNALWELGGVPGAHRTDRLSAAVQKTRQREEFTQRYAALMRHYGLDGRAIQAKRPHENGDVEQRHHRFKQAVDQALLLRGSRDFLHRREYERFLKELFGQLNAGRRGRLQQELPVLRRLPGQRLDDSKRMTVRVGPSSTIRIHGNVYSVHSRLIGEQVQVRLYAEQVEVWYGQQCVERMPRLRGQGKHAIAYRHIIDWLVRKPGAFENYRYRSDLFPSHWFRLAYDQLTRRVGQSGTKEYLKILQLAARENELAVEQVLKQLVDQSQAINAEAVQELIRSQPPVSGPPVVWIEPVQLNQYDALLEQRMVI